MARALMGEDEFYEIFVDTSLEEAEQRDPKGLYRKARSGALPNFTGIDSPYETPETPEITVHTAEESAADAAERIIDELDKAGVIAYAYNTPLAGL
jgi:bifunctional enzyme CysN/CysC